MKKIPLKHLISVLILVGITVTVYLPGLGGPMIGDDFPNIVDNPRVQIQSLDLDTLKSALLANQSGPLKRPLPSLSFALNYYFSGQQIVRSHFKLTNLLIHLATSILVYIIALLLLDTIAKPNTYNKTSLFSKNRIALLVALLWALHPIQLTAVLYVVQRMTSMATFFVLCGFLAFIIGRIQLHKGKLSGLWVMLAGITIGTVLGAACKEIALILPFLALAAELTLFSSLAVPAVYKRQLISFYAIMAVLPLAFGLVFLATHPELVMQGYESRNFTLGERLLSESRVLFMYLGLIFYPDTQQFALYHDDVLASHSLISPWTTLPAIVGLTAIIIIAVVFRKRAPVLTFAIFWFLIGHAMEASIFPLELAYEHRNYLPTVGLFFAAVYYLSKLGERYISKKWLQPILLVVFITSSTAVTYTRASIWSDRNTLAHFQLRNQPNSVRSHGTYAKNLELNNGSLEEIYEHYRIAATLDTFEVVSAIKMYRTLSVFNEFLNENPNLIVEHTQAARHYEDPLVMDPDYIAGLMVLADKEITRRLAGPVATLRASITLQGVRDCVLSEYLPCIAITQTAMGWMNTALKNPRFTQHEKSIIYLSLAKLHAFTGQTEEALRNLNHAADANHDDPYYSFERIMLYIALEDWNNVERTIDKLRVSPRLGPYRLERLNEIEVYSQQLRKESTASQLNISIKGLGGTQN